MKPELTLAEFARLLGVSRRTALRVLDRHRIPIEQVRRGAFPRHGTAIRIMTADLRTYAPKLLCGMRDVGELAAAVVVQRADSA
jgi:excisionase family DNA binding protein